MHFSSNGAGMPCSNPFRDSSLAVMPSFSLHMEVVDWLATTLEFDVGVIEDMGCNEMDDSAGRLE